MNFIHQIIVYYIILYKGAEQRAEQRAEAEAKLAEEIGWHYLV